LGMATDGETTTKPRKPTKTQVAKVAREYFDAINAHDIDAAVGMWADGGVEVVHGQRTNVAPDGIRQFFDDVIGALPDLHFEIDEATADGERCALQMTMSGTFAGPRAWQGIEPTGARIELPIVDVVEIRDGKLVRLDSYSDAMTVGRQIGMLPEQDSAGEQGMTALFNAGTVSEGDDVAGFRVVHIPGHAPGQIALWRESDRVALTTDGFYTLDRWGRDSDAHVPFGPYNLDTEQARESIRKLAALEPAAC